MATAHSTLFQTFLLSIRRDKSTDIQVLSHNAMRDMASSQRRVSRKVPTSATGSQYADGNLSDSHILRPEEAQSDQNIVDHLSNRSTRRDSMSIGDMRDTLRQAAALLCRARTDHSAIVHHLVNVPFKTFTKQSIKLGVSLWLGVINENPQMESRILSEVVEQWERTVKTRLGAFSTKLQ